MWLRLNSSDVPSENALSELLKGTSISDTAGVTESPPAPLEPPKMLLVEDNPVNMMLLATYMKRNGWDYEEATNGLIALQAFQNRPQGFDVIFMGYESIRKIRAVEAERRAAYGVQLQSLSSPPTPPSPPAFSLLVIALTGFSSQNDQEMAFDSGMDIFMTKPVRFRDVGSILDGWMKTREERSS